MPTVRRAARPALLVALALLLGACFRVEQDLTLNPENTINGTVTIAVSDELLELSGQSAEQVLAQIGEGEAPVPEGVDYTESDYQEDGYVGKTYTVTGAPLDAFSDQGDLSITREGDTFVVDGSVDLSTGATGVDPNDPTVQQLLDRFEMTIAVTFPGDVTDQNGELDGRTVTWTPAFGQTTELHAVGSAIGGGSSMSWLLFVGLAVLLAIVVAIVIASRGRGKPEGVDGAEAGDGDEAAVAAAVAGDAAVPSAPESAASPAIDPGPDAPPNADAPSPATDAPPPATDAPPPATDAPPPGDAAPPSQG